MARQGRSGLHHAGGVHNASCSATPLAAAATSLWSPTGTFTLFVALSLHVVGVDGHVVQNTMVCVGECRRWKLVRIRDYYSDTPGVAAHYATMPLPHRMQPA